MNTENAMAIKDWSNDKFSNMLGTILVVSIVFALTSLILGAWITSNQERKIYTEHNYQKCLVFNPNNNEETRIWQHTCQKIPVYYSTPIIKKED